MKNLTLSIMALALLFTGCRKDDDLTPQSDCEFIDFKYYNGTQDNLGEMSSNYILVGVDTTYSDSQIQNFISTVTDLDQNYTYTIHTTGQYKFKEIPLKLKSSKNCGQIAHIISELEQNAIVSYVHYTMKTDNCKNLIWEQIGNLCINSYGSNFYVQVFDENDLTNLNQKIAETNTGCLTISGQDLGNVVEEIFYDTDYEYWYSFDVKNTKLLITKLSERSPKLDVKELLTNNFSGLDGCSKLRTFCESFDIKYKFSSYC